MKHDSEHEIMKLGDSADAVILKRAASQYNPPIDYCADKPITFITDYNF